MQKLFRGGGTIANTLNDVPDAIDKMLKENYKKVAIIDLEGRVFQQTSSGGNKQSFEIDINSQINFNPKKYYINSIMSGSGEDRGHGLCDLDTEYWAFISSNEAFRYKFSVVDNKLIITLINQSTTYNRIVIKIYKIIAIG